jgi:CP family cyanate transporter-like MFS transporter
MDRLKFLSKPLDPEHYAGFLFILFAFLWIGINMRAPITSVAPVIQEIRADLGIGSGTVALLTSIPVLCFGVLTPAASAVIRYLGIDGAVFASLLGVALGSAVRACGGTSLMLAGTFVIGAALTIGNIVCLMIIARDFYKHMYMVTGFYVVAMSIGSMSTSALTAPLSLVTGWRFAVGAWAGLPVVAGLLWGAVVLRRRSGPGQTGPSDWSLVQKGNSGAAEGVMQNPLVWLLALAFIAHLLLFYTLTAWLPTYYMQTRNMSETTAGYVESVYQAMAFIGAFGVPMLAALKWTTSSLIMILVALVWGWTPLGFLFFPDHWIWWAVISGFAQGGGFSIIFSVLMESARNLDENRRMSALVQGTGYAVSAAGPLLIGYLHEASGSWRGSMLLLSGFSLLILLSALGVMALQRKERRRTV